VNQNLSDLTSLTLHHTVGPTTYLVGDMPVQNCNSLDNSSLRILKFCQSKEAVLSGNAQQKTDGGIEH